MGEVDEELPELPDYSMEEEPVNPEDLNRVYRLITQQAKAEYEFMQLEAKYEKIKAELTELKETLVPSAMQKVRLDSLQTQSGLYVEIVKKYRASFPQDPDKKDRAFRYLRETGNDGIVKRVITISYDRDSSAFADEVLKLLEEKNVSAHGTVSHEWTIHPSTLEKFVRESIERGDPISLTDFGAYIQTFANFSTKKKKKS